VTPAHPQDVHRPWSGSVAELSRICSLQHTRTLSKALVVSFRGQRYILPTPAHAPRHALRGRRITVCEHLDGPAARSAYENTHNDRVDQAIDRLAPKTPWKPPAHHPWRRALRSHPGSTTTNQNTP
jgi:hypothetical protein